jgi:hypothetical protein
MEITQPHKEKETHNMQQLIDKIHQLNKNSHIKVFICKP